MIKAGERPREQGEKDLAWRFICGEFSPEYQYRVVIRRILRNLLKSNVMTIEQQQAIKASQQWLDQQIRLLNQLHEGTLDKAVVSHIALNLEVVQRNLAFALDGKL